MQHPWAFCRSGFRLRLEATHCISAGISRTDDGSLQPFTALEVRLCEISRARVVLASGGSHSPAADAAPFLCVTFCRKSLQATVHLLIRPARVRPASFLLIRRAEESRALTASATTEEDPGRKRRDELKNSSPRARRPSSCLKRGNTCFLQAGAHGDNPAAAACPESGSNPRPLRIFGTLSALEQNRRHGCRRSSSANLAPWEGRFSELGAKPRTPLACQAVSRPVEVMGPWRWEWMEVQPCEKSSGQRPIGGALIIVFASEAT
jgi:hypothetical protein